jgi:hypothetical protein
MDTVNTIMLLWNYSTDSHLKVDTFHGDISAHMIASWLSDPGAAGGLGRPQAIKRPSQ